MGQCKPEEWTLKDLAKALDSKVYGNKKIVIPMFQRRQCWDSKREAEFVDSLRRGFPVGAMLFYKTVVKDKEVYTLIDGLQRSNTIRKYLNRPTKIFSSSGLTDDLLDEIIKIFNIHENEVSMKQTVSNAAGAYLRELSKIDEIEKYEMAKAIIKECGADLKNMDLNEAVQKIIAPYVSQIKEEYAEIEKIVVPILVYNGEVSSLPEIFERINSGGVPLMIMRFFQLHGQ